MACRKVCKQGRDDIANSEGKFTKAYPYICSYITVAN